MCLLCLLYACSVLQYRAWGIAGDGAGVDKPWVPLSEAVFLSSPSCLLLGGAPFPQNLCRRQSSITEYFPNHTQEITHTEFLIPY